MRIGEITGLTWEDVIIDEQSIATNNARVIINKELSRVNAQAMQKLKEKDIIKIFPTQKPHCTTRLVLKTPKTETSIRTVPINSYCRKALEKQIIQHKIVMAKTCRKNLEFPDFLFTTKLGTPLNAQLYCDAIERIVQEVNLMRDPLDLMETFSGHCFRHTFATRCFEAGIVPKTVQAYLGHASLQMTMDLYTAVMEHKKVNDMQLLEDSIDLPDPAAEINLASNEKVIKFCG